MEHCWSPMHTRLVISMLTCYFNHFDLVKTNLTMVIRWSQVTLDLMVQFCAFGIYLYPLQCPILELTIICSRSWYFLFIINYYGYIYDVGHGWPHGLLYKWIHGVLVVTFSGFWASKFIYVVISNFHAKKRHIIRKLIQLLSNHKLTKKNDLANKGLGNELGCYDTIP